MNTLGDLTGSGERPGISVVIPTYNNAALLAECLDAVQDLDYPSDRLEIVVVDNASTDRTRETLARRYPQARVIPLENNTGFAVACNRGAQAAAGEYVAFLNNDAVPEPQWLNALLAALRAGPEGTVCAGSKIVSRDGRATEYDGAGSNLFGAGRPHSTWGWPDMSQPPSVGSPVLFASGGAMLIDKSVFIDSGGFDPEYFAYFEDVDLGWRLWILGHAVVYAPDAIVRHIGGATGRRVGAHRRYTLWESNSLATVIKNYETGHMERILFAALMLEYRRALLAAGEAVNPSEYALTAPKDTNQSNVERLPKVSVAHLAAVDRLNTMLPHLMLERARVQALRKRSDREILPLLGRLYAPQFAGEEYAGAAEKLAAALGLFDMTDPIVPPRVLVLATTESASEATALAEAMSSQLSVAIAYLDSVIPSDSSHFTIHNAAPGSGTLSALVAGADVVLVTGTTPAPEEVTAASKPVALLGRGPGTGPFPRIDPRNIDEVLAFCRSRGVELQAGC